MKVLWTYFVKIHIRGMFNDSLHIFYIVSCPQTHQLEKGIKIAKNNHICTFLNCLKRKQLGNKVTYYKVCTWTSNSFLNTWNFRFHFFSTLRMQYERTQILYELKMCVTDSVWKMLQMHYERGYRFITNQMQFFHEILKWLCRFRDKLITH